MKKILVLMFVSILSFNATARDMTPNEFCSEAGLLAKSIALGNRSEEVKQLEVFARIRAFTSHTQQYATDWKVSLPWLSDKQFEKYKNSVITVLVWEAINENLSSEPGTWDDVWIQSNNLKYKVMGQCIEGLGKPADFKG